MIIDKIRQFLRPLPSPKEIDEARKEREELHEKWQEDYERRRRRAYELEQRTNWLTERMFMSADGSEEYHGSRGD